MMFIYRLHGVDVFSHACSLSSISEAHIRQVTSQLLCAIDYLQSRHIVHCDIKVDKVVIQVNMNFIVISKIGFTVPLPKCKLCTGCVGLMSSPISGSRPSCLSKSHNGYTYRKIVSPHSFLILTPNACRDFKISPLWQRP